MNFRFFACRLSFVSLILFLSVTALHADNVLFFGNSFTSTNNIPQMVEDIAKSKAKKLSVTAITEGGKGFDYHLAQPTTDPAIKSKAWNWVVLQDQSLNATHVAKPGEFMKTGEQFYDRIALGSPDAGIVLYETWAYSPQNTFFTPTGTAKPAFAGPEVMYGEIQKNVAALQVLLQAKDPKRQVLVAPVGAAFAKCVAEHPEINIFSSDFKHPDPAGSYLSALVLYATLFHDSPLGAALRPRMDPQVAKTLQEIAESVTAIK